MLNSCNARATHGQIPVIVDLALGYSQVVLGQGSPARQAREGQMIPAEKAGACMFERHTARRLSGGDPRRCRDFQVRPSRLSSSTRLPQFEETAVSNNAGPSDPPCWAQQIPICVGRRSSEGACRPPSLAKQRLSRGFRSFGLSPLFRQTYLRGASAGAVLGRICSCVWTNVEGCRFRLLVPVPGCSNSEIQNSPPPGL
jgi:hypothetical protein